MRVVHLIDHLGLGGSQSLLLDLLEEHGPTIEAEVWTLRNRVLPQAAERLQNRGIRLQCLNMTPLNPLRLKDLRTALARARPDLLHTRLDVSNSLGVAAALTLGPPRPRIVCQIENDPGVHYGLATRWWLRRTASVVDAHIVISPSLRQAAQRFLYGARRLEMVLPGIDLARFDPTLVSHAAIQRLRGTAARVVGTVGRLADQKGLEVLLDATPLLLKADPNTRILVAGDGPSRAALKARSRRLAISHAVQFLGYRADIEAVYGALDVLVMPSRHEGFGLAFIEAMAMGTPVVGTHVVGSVDAVRDGITGLLVPPDDPPALAGAIVRLLRDPELRRAITTVARQWVRAHCSRESVAHQTEALYAALR